MRLLALLAWCRPSRLRRWLLGALLAGSVVRRSRRSSLAPPPPPPAPGLRHCRCASPPQQTPLGAARPRRHGRRSRWCRGRRRRPWPGCAGCRPCRGGLPLLPLQVLRALPASGAVLQALSGAPPARRAPAAARRPPAMPSRRWVDFGSLATGLGITASGRSKLLFRHQSRLVSVAALQAWPPAEPALAGCRPTPAADHRHAPSHLQGQLQLLRASVTQHTAPCAPAMRRRKVARTVWRPAAAAAAAPHVRPSRRGGWHCSEAPCPRILRPESFLISIRL